MRLGFSGAFLKKYWCSSCVQRGYTFDTVWHLLLWWSEWCCKETSCSAEDETLVPRANAVTSTLLSFLMKEHAALTLSCSTAIVIQTWLFHGQCHRSVHFTLQLKRSENGFLSTSLPSGKIWDKARCAQIHQQPVTWKTMQEIHGNICFPRSFKTTRTSIYVKLVVLRAACAEAYQLRQERAFGIDVIDFC